MESSALRIVAIASQNNARVILQNVRCLTKVCTTFQFGFVILIYEHIDTIYNILHGCIDITSLNDTSITWINSRMFYKQN